MKGLCYPIKWNQKLYSILPIILLTGIQSSKDLGHYQHCYFILQLYVQEGYLSLSFTALSEDPKLGSCDDLEEMSPPSLANLEHLNTQLPIGSYFERIRRCATGGEFKILKAFCFLNQRAFSTGAHSLWRDILLSLDMGVGGPWSCLKVMCQSLLTPLGKPYPL